MAVEWVPICQGELAMVWLCGWHPSPLHRFPSHANFQAFFEAAVLTLIAMVLVNGTIPVGTACVTEVPSYAPFEEAFAPLASKLAIVFTTRFIPANNAFYVLWLLFLRLHRLVCRRRLYSVVRGSLDGCLRGRRGDLRA